MTARSWWLGVAAIIAALALHAAFPRYDWRAVARHPDMLVRVDRWTGHAEYGVMERTTGTWMSVSELRARQHDAAIAQLLREADAALATPVR